MNLLYVKPGPIGGSVEFGLSDYMVQRFRKVLDPHLGQLLDTSKLHTLQIILEAELVKAVREPELDSFSRMFDGLFSDFHNPRGEDNENS